MGDTCWLRPDDGVARVDAPQQDAAKVEGPDAVVELLQADRVLLARARGGPVEGGRGPAAQGFVRTLRIVEAPEGGERPLLRREIGARRTDRLAFERLVHPLVGAVLLPKDKTCGRLTLRRDHGTYNDT